MVAREEPTGFTRNRSGRVGILGAAGSVVSIYSRNSSPVSTPLLVGDELVRPTEEDLRGQVPAQLSAQGALHCDRLEGTLPATVSKIAAGNGKNEPNGTTSSVTRG